MTSSGKALKEPCGWCFVTVSQHQIRSTLYRQKALLPFTAQGGRGGASWEGHHSRLQTVLTEVASGTPLGSG